MIEKQKIVSFVDLLTRKEFSQLKDTHINFANSINFANYEAFFRIFCKNKYVEYEHNLRANYESLNEGIKKLYGGIENEFLSRLLYNYFGKGNINHLITLSEFVVFIHELQLSTKHINSFVF